MLGTKLSRIIDEMCHYHANTLVSAPGQMWPTANSKVVVTVRSMQRGK